MSFLDNLESNLKSLESREEAQDARSHQQRASTRAQALAIAPWAEKLKASPFTEELLREATRLGYLKRTKVRMSWIGTALRLETSERRLELRPTAEGIVAVSSEGGHEAEPKSIDLDNDSAADLAKRWLDAAPPPHCG
jgi:hypothetical protein